MKDDGETTSFKVDGLEGLLKALKQKPPTARVGILGSKATTKHPGSQATVAEIGAIHEFGTSTIPMRSFLRMPINTKLQKELERSGTFDQDTMKAVIKQGTVIPYLEKIANAATFVIIDAFETGGFGEWPAWKNPNYENNTGELLVDTTRLMDSITYEVKA